MSLIGRTGYWQNPSGGKIDFGTYQLGGGPGSFTNWLPMAYDPNIPEWQRSGWLNNPYNESMTGLQSAYGAPEGWMGGLPAQTDQGNTSGTPTGFLSALPGILNKGGIATNQHGIDWRDPTNQQMLMYGATGGGQAGLDGEQGNPLDMTNNQTNVPEGFFKALPGMVDLANQTADQQTGSFNIPTDLYQYSTSGSAGGGASQSGINWNSPVTQSILPQLIASGVGLPGIAENMGNELQNFYTNTMNQALKPEAFQGTLNNLASKNMLNSSVAGDALSQTATSIADNIANNAYSAKLAQLQSQMQVPSLLAELARLGQISGSTTASQSYSKSADPGAPYRTMADILTY